MIKTAEIRKPNIPKLGYILWLQRLAEKDLWKCCGWERVKSTTL